jgi:hypothetical protein
MTPKLLGLRRGKPCFVRPLCTSFVGGRRTQEGGCGCRSASWRTSLSVIFRRHLKANVLLFYFTVVKMSCKSTDLLLIVPRLVEYSSQMEGRFIARSIIVRSIIAVTSARPLQPFDPSGCRPFVCSHPYFDSLSSSLQRRIAARHKYSVMSTSCSTNNAFLTGQGNRRTNIPCPYCEPMFTH